MVCGQITWSFPNSVHLSWTTVKSLLNLLQYCFCFTFWFFGPEACGILAPRPGIEPASSALEGEVLTTGPPGKSPKFCLKSLHQPHQPKESALVQGPPSIHAFPLSLPGLTTHGPGGHTAPHRCLVTSSRTRHPRCQASGKELLPHHLAAGSLVNLAVISLIRSPPRPWVFLVALLSLI